MANFALRYEAETINKMIISIKADMVLNIIGIPLTLITIKVIKGYSSMEPLLHEIKDEEETSHTNV